MAGEGSGGGEIETRNMPGLLTGCLLLLFICTIEKREKTKRKVEGKAKGM